MNTKIILIICVVFILGIGAIAWTFYNQKQALEVENKKLQAEKQVLSDEYDSLKEKYSATERERNDVAQKLSVVNEQLTKLEAEKDSWKNKWQDVSKERDMLVERLNKSQPAAEISVSTITPQPVLQQAGGASEDHWADFVKEKAALGAKVEDLGKALFEAKNTITKLDKDNKELSIKIDQLSKERERLDEEIRFKERTLRVMSMDLVSEREERSAAVTELRKLRDENVSLKRELVLANKEKLKIQEDLKGTMEKKEGLEDRLSDAENVLKEKTLAFDDLQNQLQRAITGGKKLTATESASVELPPIVVKPEAPGLKGLRGEVIAVNTEEKFIVVDIGESSGLRPGALLKVMRGDKEIATVEVIETRREISAADIKEVIGGFSIKEGDIVISR
jgi:chromosome segregation ATPase